MGYGVFKAAGKEEELVDAIGQRIDAGENRLLRVLAQVRLHQGQVDEALALELAYIDGAGFDELSRAFRRGLAFENARKLPDAVEMYELALALPYRVPNLPDLDEEAVQASMMRQMTAPMLRPNSPMGQTQFQAGVLDRLQRLYAALGQAEKVFEITLRQFDANPALLDNLETLVQAARQAEVLSREERFSTWLAGQIPRARTPGARANIHWVRKDYQACSQALAESFKGQETHGYAYQGWFDRFRAVGVEQLRLLLTTILDADPANALARLELLDLSNRFDGPEAIAAFESLLETDASAAFVHGKGVYNRTRFRNYFDLAYRLMRLYEKADQLEKLQKLGLRIAKGEKPFDEWWKPANSHEEYHDDEGLPEDVNPCLSILLDRADGDTLAQLDDFWSKLGDFPARRQLARRLAGGGEESPQTEDIGWANCPRGVRAIVSHENVLSVARDERHIYAGHPWGVAVYDLEGNAVTRIALGEAAQALAVLGEYLWAGTPKGLFRIDPTDWTVGHVWLHGDVPDDRRHGRSPGTLAPYWFDNGVYTLAPDGEELWIGLHRNVQRLNTRTMTLRAYSYRELKLDSWGGTSRILPEQDYVWAAGGSMGLRRYDRASDTWEKVEYKGREVGLIGVIDGNLFGHVWLNDKLRDRPCRIDRKTLEVTPLLIEGNLTDDQRSINGPFTYYGTYRGQLVFGPGNPGYAYDEETGKLRPIGMPWDRPDDPIQSILPAGYRSGRLEWLGPVASPPDGAVSADLVVRQAEGDSWTMLIAPDGLMVVGKRQAHKPRYEYPAEDWPFGDIVWDKKDGAGGLWLLAPGAAAKRVSNHVQADVLLGDNVFDAVADPSGDCIWLCTDMGLAILDTKGRVIARYSRADGLCCNRVTSAVKLGGKLFFSTGWGDHGGGLGIYNPITCVFTARFQPDGLATNKLDRIEPIEGRLRLVYDVEYGRGGAYAYRLFPPGEYDPATHKMAAAGAPSYPSQNDAFKSIQAAHPRAGRMMPLIGGWVVCEKAIAGKTYLCGTRGLLIFEGNAPPASEAEELAVTLVTDPEDVLRMKAKEAAVVVKSPDDLRKYLASENPFMRVRALCEARLMDGVPAGYLPLLCDCVGDPHPRVRSTAVFLLARGELEGALPALEKALGDGDPQIRAVAALTLARLGRRPALRHFEEMLTRDYGNMPYDIDSSVGVQAGRDKAYAALARDADPAVFALLMKYPPHIGNYNYETEVYPYLGASLRRHPEVAPSLLLAYDGEGGGSSVCDFSQHVFRFAGEAMLPVLHEALQSDDRVVRSNAARACGAVGHASSIPRLIKALDLESGLSRGSIVWALGTLTANAALPALAKLYIDARNDERCRAGSGFRMAQAAAVAQSQFEQLRDVAEIGAEWDELKAVAQPKLIDPRRNEPLLSPEMILEAVRKIGPEASQAFYRTLAAESDTAARREAAMRLAECEPEAAAANLPVLRNLLADPSTEVRISAAVSLLIFGQEDMSKWILGWLELPGGRDQWPAAQELCRVQDATKLQFARKALEQLLAQPSNRWHNDQPIRNLLERIPRD